MACGDHRITQFMQGLLRNAVIAPASTAHYLVDSANRPRCADYALPAESLILTFDRLQLQACRDLGMTHVTRANHAFSKISTAHAHTAYVQAFH